MLIVDATGSAGTMAVQTARRPGASRVIACGSDEQLTTLGASDVVSRCGGT